MRIRGIILGVGFLAAVAATAGADGPTGSARGALGGGGLGPVLPGRGATGGEDLLAERRERNQRPNRRTPTSAPSPTGPSVPPAPPARAEPAARPERSLVHLHHGSVRLVADLAHVDLTLEVQNVASGPIEWRRTYAIDPAAEVIGAVLRREGEDAIWARTLTAPDAERIYGQVRTPPPTRTPRGNRDPLLLQRTARDRLDVVIWPVAPGETIRVELTFVTPLRGRGAHRTYVDVMGGSPPTSTPQALERPGEDGQAPGGGFFLTRADWLVDPGTLVLSSAPAQGMTLHGEAGGLLHFAGAAATEPSTPRPSVDFLTAQRAREALVVGSGSLWGRIAVWRFDPRGFLAAHGFESGGDVQLRLVPERGLCTRLAPDLFQANDEPLPVTTLLVEPGATEVRYQVEVVDRSGFVIERFDEALALRRETLDETLEAAVTGWHRAALVERVFRWAGTEEARREQAVRYAVDLGVLVPGSAALAVPTSERRRLTPRNRRLYDTDGVPLGAPGHEADAKAAPRGALSGR